MNIVVPDSIPPPNFDDKIPKICHQIWYDKRGSPSGVYLGPKMYLEKIESFSRHNPEWQHYLWTDVCIDILLHQPEHYKFLKLFRQLHHAIQKADFARLFILYLYGGIYVDLDFRTLKPIDQLIDRYQDEHRAIMFMQMTRKEAKSAWLVDCITNSSIIVKPRSEAILHIIFGYIGSAIWRFNPKTEVLNLTGPLGLHKYLYGYPSRNKLPSDSDIVHPEIREVLDEYFYIAPDQHSGWSKDIIKAHVDYYVLRWAVIFLLIIIFWCAILFFYSPYAGIYTSNTKKNFDYQIRQYFSRQQTSS